MSIGRHGSISTSAPAAIFLVGTIRVEAGHARRLRGSSLLELVHPSVLGVPLSGDLQLFFVGGGHEALRVSIGILILLLLLEELSLIHSSNSLSRTFAFASENPMYLAPGLEWFVLLKPLLAEIFFLSSSFI